MNSFPRLKLDMYLVTDIKVKQYRYRPGVAERVPGSSGS
jgi:hypothetical protein